MKVASFNIQKFGKNKVSDPDVLNILVQIVSRYDIIVILEVVDITGESVRTFLHALNRANGKHHYTLKISSRLGRTRYKEQFMFLYRDNMVDLVGSYQFDDEEEEGGDVFAREPYILRFRCLNTVLKDLVLIPVHTKPQDSERELDELYDVFLAVKRRWRTDVHTHNRIVVYGDDMLQAVVPNSAKSFNFQVAYGLSDEQTLKVSDHYPVELQLKSSGSNAPPADGLKPPLVDDDLQDLKRGNLLLEREKLSLEIQILRMKMASMSRQEELLQQ
ncbi:deoxyribonuclease gamma-like [Pseudoliparis swirei]|uniref:deoxyribonuclease gamma-like n=1 Tax=Pseudoliparis swirei TaxID=2059687 RepID=UPI0024BEB6F0|nr:deoxyribonuclease gamma-like [Pseudoliparis swirei]